MNYRSPRVGVMTHSRDGEPACAQCAQCTGFMSEGQIRWLGDSDDEPYWFQPSAFGSRVT